MRWKLWVGAGVVLLLVVVVAATRAPEVSVTQAARGTLVLEFAATGEVETVEAEVGPRGPGIVEAMLVREGEKVTEGQALARLRAQAEKAAVEGATAAEGAAQAELGRAAATLKSVANSTEAGIKAAQAEVEATAAQLALLRAGARPQEVAAAEAALAGAQARVDQALAGLEEARKSEGEQKALGAAQVGAAQANLEVAQAALRKAEAGYQSEEIAAAEAGAEVARARADEAAAALGRARALYAQGALSRSELDAAEASAKAAAGNLTQAEQQVALLKSGSRSEDVDAARAQVEQARQTLEQARRTAEQSLVAARARVESARALVEQAQASAREAKAREEIVRGGARPEEVEAAKARVAAARAGLGQAESSRFSVAAAAESVRAAAAGRSQTAAAAREAKAVLAESVLTAPFEGVVTKRLAEPGDLVSPQQPALAVADLDSRWVTARVDEEDAAKIRLGQDVEVTSDGYPGRVFPGTIWEIAPAAEGKVFTGARAKVVRAKVRVTRDADLLKVGMEVDIRGGRSTQESEVLVPVEAIAQAEGKSYVWRVEGGRARRLAVRVGATDYRRTEVLSGLGEGETVVVGGLDKLKEGMRVRVRQWRLAA